MLSVYDRDLLKLFGLSAFLGLLLAVGYHLNGPFFTSLACFSVILLGVAAYIFYEDGLWRERLLEACIQASVVAAGLAAGEGTWLWHVQNAVA